MKKNMNLVFCLPYLIFILFVCLGGTITLMGSAQNATVSVKVGVVVDYDSWVGMMGLSCIDMALSDLYASNINYTTRLLLHTRDSKSDVVSAAAAAVDLIKNVEVQAIIGSVTSMQANFIVDLGKKAQVPIISYSTADPSLKLLGSSYFIQATQSEAYQVKVISAIVEAFGWREVVPIYSDNVYGEGLIPFLTDALQEVDAHVPYRSVISSSATDDQLAQELQKLVTMQIRVFIVHTPNVSLGARIFTKAHEINMMTEGFVWITTNVMTSFLGSLDPSVVDSMQGVLGIKTYVPETKELKEFSARWKKLQQLQHDNNRIFINSSSFELNVFGLWAYDAAPALAIAIEEVIGNNGSFVFKKQGNSTNLLETFGVSQNGPKLLEALSDVQFRGHSGNFTLVDRQLHSSTYKIINVDSFGERVVGFWTPQNGLIRRLSSTKTSTASYLKTGKYNLGPIIWPGESLSIPKGWGFQRNLGSLRIGVPIKEGFQEFVRVNFHSGTNTFTGYCIEIFEAVIKEMPYNVCYMFIPFMNPNGTSAGTYDDLVYQVYLGNFDAVVGDVTITANKSLYVDFSIAFTDPGVSIIIPSKMRRNNIKYGWIFLDPWTWDLWVISTSFCVFISFVVWVLEHPVNEDFQGPPSNQVSMSFWFSFSTMVLANRETVVSNLARFVVIVWIFVVLILSQSYSASLASFLTVQQLSLDTNDVLNDLLKNNKPVASQSGSFVQQQLRQVGIMDSQMKSYSSLEEANELVLKGSVAAIIDENPYIKLFLAKYCNYTMVGPIMRTDGFGFAFRKGLPMLFDFSSTLLRVMEGEAMKKIENEWFNKNSCPDNNVSSSLGPASFWGLFLIAGVSSLSALLIRVAIFFYGKRHIILSSAPTEASKWKKIHLIFTTFCQRYSTPHRNRTIDNVRGVVPVEAINNANNSTLHSPSPSFLDHSTDSNLSFSGSTELADLNQAGPSVELAIQN